MLAEDEGEVGVKTRHATLEQLALTDEQLSEILADVELEPILIDHYALKLFPKSPEDRMSFRKAIREIILCATSANTGPASDSENAQPSKS